VCGMTGFLHVMVPHERFELITGRDALASYRFGTGAAQHIFCTQCGIKSFYRPRSHPGHISVNYRCLDEDHGLEATIVRFDGRNHPGAVA